MSDDKKKSIIKDRVFDDYDPEVKVRTKKMMMYFIIFAIVMLFAGVTSAFVLLRPKTYWVHVEPTTMLYLSIAIIIASSLTMILSVRSIKKGNIGGSRTFLLVTLILGILFSVTQYMGWKELKDKGMGVTITETEEGLKKYSWNNISKIKGEYGVDYFVEKDGTRLLFINGEYYLPSDKTLKNPITAQVTEVSNGASGLIFVLIFAHILHLIFGLAYMIANFRRINLGIVTAEDSVQLHVNGIYWHFMGILWIYLFVFLFIIH